MKKFFLFIAVCLMATAMQATIVLTCGFEASEGWNGGFAEGWSTETVSWGSEVFNLYTTDGHGGAQCLRIISGDWDTEDAYLNFPAIDFGEEEVECTITFWAKTADGGSVYFGYDEIEITSTDWAPYTYTTTLSGEQALQLDGYVEDGQILYLDDIVVKYRDDEPVAPAEPILLTVPYANNFDTVAGSLPYGWTVISDQDWNLEIKSAGNAHSGNKYLSFIYGSPAKYAILPQYNGELSGLSISLWYKTRDHWESGDLTVGVMSDPADASTFTAIQQLPKTSTAQTTTGVYAQATVDLSSAPANCHYIAIRYSGTASGENNMVYVDDLEVFATPANPSTDLDKEYVRVYAYYPDLVACFKWDVLVDINPDEEFYAAYVLDSIDTYDANTTIDGISGGFINEISVNAPDGVTYDGVTAAAASEGGMGYWMYNLNDQMAQLGISSQPVVSGDVIFWEFKTDWSSWDITQLADVPSNVYFVDFGIINPSAAPCVSAYTEETETACDSLVWNGQTYTLSGDYTFNGQTAAGCDSTAVLHLTISHAVSDEFSATTCDSLVWKGQTYTESGDYTFTGQTAEGCDAVEVLHLTINKSTLEEQTITATGSYVWNGQTYTLSGDYTFTGQTAEGCDAVEVLHLTIEAESALGNVKAGTAQKFIENGQLFIRKGENVFDVLGNQVR